MNTITVSTVEKDYAGSGTIRICGTYADVTHYQPSQQVTVPDIPSTNYNWSRSLRLTDAALSCIRNGANSVAMYATSWSKLCYGFEPTLTYAPVFSADPEDESCVHSSTSADFTATAASEITCIYTWKESADGTTYGSALTTTGIYDVGVRATGTLTAGGTPSNGDTVLIGGKSYKFVTVLTESPGVEGEVLIDGQDNSLTNLQDSINWTTSGANNGTKYWAAAAHPLVTCGGVSSHAITVTAVGGGSAANAIITVESGSNLSWGAVTLAGGTASAAGDGGLRITPTTTDQNGYYYRCTAVNLAGSTNSSAAALTVT